MTDHFHLLVYTPARTLADRDVREVTAPAVDGEIGVLPDHAGLMTALAPGVLTYKADGSVVKLEIGSGFAEVLDNVMTVLADSGEPLAA